MTVIGRLLDAAAVVLAAATVAVLVTGGWADGPVAISRAEDLLVALALTAAARMGVRPYPLPAAAPRRMVGAGMVAYLAVMSFIVVTRHWMLRTHALDLGQYLQVIWSIAAGHGALTTMPPVHFWGEHFSPVFYLLAPLIAVLPRPETLLVAQTAILAAGAPAVFAFARPRIGDRAAAAFALLYLLNPSIHGMNLRDVHPAAFAVALVPAAAWALDAGRWGACATALALVLACREDAAIAVVGFGLWVVAARGRWMLGAGIAVGALAVLAVEIAWLMPLFRGAPYPHLARWPSLGSSLGGILLTLVLRPWRWLPVALTARRAVYLAAMVAPLGFLPLAAWRALAGAAPALAMNLLSADDVLVHHRSQYQAFVVPFLFLAAVDGYRSLAERWRGRTGRRSLAAALAFAFVASVILTARTVNDLAVPRWWPGPTQRAAYALMARIPPGASVSANERLVPHLAMRREIFVYPTNAGWSDWVLVRETELAALPASYREVARDGGWVLLRREGRPYPDGAAGCQAGHAGGCVPSGTGGRDQNADVPDRRAAVHGDRPGALRAEGTRRAPRVE